MMSIPFVRIDEVNELSVEMKKTIPPPEKYRLDNPGIDSSFDKVEA